MVIGACFFLCNHGHRSAYSFSLFDFVDVIQRKKILLSACTRIGVMVVVAGSYGYSLAHSTPMVSIPRDTYTTTAGEKEETIRAVEQFLDVPVDDVFRVDMAGFEGCSLR